MSLSEREQELYDFIKANNGITVKQIQNQLGPKHVGAISKLKRINKVKKEKRREGEPGYNNNNKMVTYYAATKEEVK